MEDSKTVDLLRILYVGITIFISWLGIWRNFLVYDFPAIIAILGGGYPIFKEAYRALKSRDVTMEVAMSIGMVASLAVGEFLAAVIIAFFTLIAEFLDEFTMDKSRAAIEELVNISPKKARLKGNNGEVEVGIEKVRLGDVVIVKPGEKIPVDGRVMAGRAAVNQAPITGESMPVEKSVGSEVFAGTINQKGFLEIEVTRVGEETTLGRIITLVEEAEASKAPIQRFADRFASRFVPLVLLISSIVFLATRNIVSSIAVIVVACPCAVALATPLAVVASIGSAARKGIIIKGGVYLEELSRVDTIVLDKTGTLTLGVPEVTDVKGFDGHGAEEIITLAAVAERHSEHPLAQAIAEKAEEHGMNVPEHKDCQIIPGKGVVCYYEDKTIIMGNREILHDNQITISAEVEKYMDEKENLGETAMLIAHDSHVCGVICVADIIRRDAVESINELRSIGIKRFIMLTGDNPRTAKAVATRVGINEVFSEMLPQEKVAKVRGLVKEGRRVLMVGDGVNDAPALAEASVGIAMGVAGTDAAIEAADVALMTDSFRNIAESIKIGRRAFGTIRQNLLASTLFNIVGVSLASLGVLNPLMAAVAHVIPDLILFINSSKLILK